MDAWWVTHLRCFPVAHHQAMLTECYPSNRALTGQNPIRQPDSNALSKLTYYCSLRPSKLSKISAALRKRTHTDVAHNSSRSKARICITLVILKRLIEDCRSDLAYFAKDVLLIINMAVQVTENVPAVTGKKRPNLEISERAAGVFHAYSTFSENTSMAIDSDMTSIYVDVLKNFALMAKEPSCNEWDDAPALRIIGLHATDAVVNTDVLFSSSFEYLARDVLSSLLFNIVDHPVDPDLVDIEKTLSNGDGQGKKLERSTRQPLSERRARSIHTNMNDINGKEMSVKVQDVAFKAMQILRSLFRSPLRIQIPPAIESIIAFFDSYEEGRTWKNTRLCTFLGEKMAGWTLIQYRSLVLDQFLDHLVVISSKQRATSVLGTRNSTPTDIVNSARYSSLLLIIRSILTGPASLIGVGVGEVLNKLIDLIIIYAGVDKTDESAQHYPSLVKLTMDCIVGLCNRLYYGDQSADIAGDILQTIATLQASIHASIDTEEDEGTNTCEALASRKDLSASVRDRATEALIGTLREIIIRINQTPANSSCTKQSTQSIGGGVAGTSAPTAIEEQLEKQNNDPSGIIPQAVRSNSAGTVPSDASIKNAPVRLSSDEKRGPSSSISATNSSSQSPIEPSTLEPSLALLCQAAAPVRKVYARMLAQYLEKELRVKVTSLNLGNGGSDNGTGSDGPQIGPSNWSSDDAPFAQFIKVLLGNSLKLLTSERLLKESKGKLSRLGSGSRESKSDESSPSMKHPYSTATSSSSDSESQRVNSVSFSSAASPVEYIFARDVLFALFSRCSAVILVLGVPFLIGLDRDAENIWDISPNDGTTDSVKGCDLSTPAKGIQLKARSIACREIVADSFIALGHAWGLNNVVEFAQMKRHALAAEVVPEKSSFTTEEQLSESIVNERFDTIDASELSDAHGENYVNEIVSEIAKSKDAQAALGDIDEVSVINVLKPSEVSYTPQAAQHPRDGVTPLKLPNNGGKSTEQLRPDRLKPNWDSHMSTRRTPSISDLKGSLAELTPSLFGAGMGNGPAASSASNGSFYARRSGNSSPAAESSPNVVTNSSHPDVKSYDGSSTNSSPVFRRKRTTSRNISGKYSKHELLAQLEARSKSQRSQKSEASWNSDDKMSTERGKSHDVILNPPYAP